MEWNDIQKFSCDGILDVQPYKLLKQEEKYLLVFIKTIKMFLNLLKT